MTGILKTSLLFLLVLSLFCAFSCFASADAELTASGTCGDNLTWELANGDLTVSGTGNMAFTGAAPWAAYSQSILRVIIENGVENIQGGAFNDCANLTLVSVPASVTDIDVTAFNGCTSLAEFDVSRDNPVYSDAGDGLYNKLQDVLFLAAKAKATYDRYVPDGGTHAIGAYALAGCINFKQVMLPIDVASIGEYAFIGCTGLPDLLLPDNLTSIGAGAFSGCTALEAMVIPSGVTEIYEDTFHGCSSLRKVTIPGGVKSIGAGAFSGCSALREIVYGGTEAEWATASAGAFDPGTLDTITVTCRSMTATGICGDHSTWVLFSDGSLLVEGIGEMYSGSDLDAINCNKVRTAVVSEGITIVGGRLFDYCYNLTKVTLPSTCTKIDYNTFYLCKKLTDINLPDGLTTIGVSAFEDCYALPSITLPASITNIENNAFRSCYALTDINFPDGLITIGNNAFCNCTALPSITLPASVTHIGNGGFSYCSSLTQVVFLGDAPNPTTPISGTPPTGMFQGNTSTAFYPAGASGWTEEAKQLYDGQITWVGLEGADSAAAAYASAKAQYFSGGAGQGAGTGTYAAVTAASLSAYQPSLVGALPAGVTYEGTSLILEDTVTVRHFFKLADAAGPYAFELNGVSAVPQENGPYYTVDVKGIPFAALGQRHTVGVSAGSSAWSMSYCPLSYAQRALAQQAEPSLSTLMQAMCLYYFSLVVSAQ